MPHAPEIWTKQIQTQEINYADEAKQLDSFYHYAGVDRRKLLLTLLM